MGSGGRPVPVSSHIFFRELRDMRDDDEIVFLPLMPAGVEPIDETVDFLRRCFDAVLGVACIRHMNTSISDERKLSTEAYPRHEKWTHG